MTLILLMDTEKERNSADAFLKHAVLIGISLILKRFPRLFSGLPNLFLHLKHILYIGLLRMESFSYIFYKWVYRILDKLQLTFGYCKYNKKFFPWLIMDLSVVKAYRLA